MVFQAEWTLMALVIGLYFYDSALLLYANEGVLTPQGRDGWAVKLGSTLRLAGRELFVPSPLTLHRPLFRLAWSFEPTAHADRAWTSRRDAFRPIAPLMGGMALAAFVLLPLGLFSRLGDRMVLAAIGVLYVNIVAAIGWLVVRRTALRIAPARLARLALEALVCAPFALNLVRKLSLEMPIGEDLIEAARRLQKGEDWRASRARFAARLEEELLEAGEDSPRAAALMKYRESLLT